MCYTHLGAIAKMEETDVMLWRSACFYGAGARCNLLKAGEGTGETRINNETNLTVVNLREMQTMTL